MSVTFYFARHGETLFNVAGKVQGWADSPLSPYGVYSAYKLGNGLADIDFVGACTSDSQRAEDTLSIALEARENERQRRRSGRDLAAEEVLLDNNDCFPDLSEFGDMDEIAALEQFLRTRGCLEPRSTVPDTAATPPVVTQWMVFSEQWTPSVGQVDAIEYPARALPFPAFMEEGEPPLPIRRDTRLREWCFGDLEGQPTVKLRNRLYDLFGDDLPRAEQNKRIDEIADYIWRTDKSHRAENFAAISTRIASFLDDCGASVARAGGGNVLVVTHAMFIRALVFMFCKEPGEDPSRIANASLTKVIWDAGAVTVEAVGDTSHLTAGVAPKAQGVSSADETSFAEDAPQKAADAALSLEDDKMATPAA